MVPNRATHQKLILMLLQQEFVWTEEAHAHAFGVIFSNVSNAPLQFTALPLCVFSWLNSQIVSLYHFFFRLIMTLFIFFHHNHYCSIFIYLRFLPLSSFLVLQLDITWLAHHLDSTTFLKYLIFYVIDIIRYLVEQIFTRICFWDFVTSSQNISSGKFQEIFSHGNMFS